MSRSTLSVWQYFQIFFPFYLNMTKTFHLTVFLTHIGIRQMPTRLPTWKAKSLYHIGTFLPTWFILPLKNCKDIFKYICFTLYLQQTVNNWESAIIFIHCHCLWCFFSVDNRSNQFRVYLIIWLIIIAVYRIKIGCWEPVGPCHFLN